eukprot:Sdes_comp9511_c0_seq1m981
MSTNTEIRYTVLPTTESNASAEPAPVVFLEPTSEQVPPERDANDLPQYDAVQQGVLPSYEQVELAKQDETGLDDGNLTIYNSVYLNSEPTIGGYPLGDDSSFMGALLVVTLFSWIGYIAAYFFSSSIAGKCGATSGLGLVMIKIGLLIGHAKNISSHASDRSEMFAMGFFILSGLLIFARGIVLYFDCKRSLLSSLRVV